MSRKIVKAVTLKELSTVKVDKTKMHSKKLYRIFSRMDGSLDYFIWTYMDKKGTIYYDPKLDFLPITEDKGEESRPSLRNMTKNNAEIIRQEQIENFKWLNEHTEKKLDMAEVEKIIRETPIKVYEIDDSNIGPEGIVTGFVHKDGYIAFSIKTCMQKTPEGKILRFHEYIHLIQGKLQEKDENISRIINEAQTESLALRRATPDRSVYMGFAQSEKKAMVRLNFHAIHYVFSVCILRQLEAILGRKSYEKDFTSSRDLSEEFVKKYGLDLYTFIVARMETIDTDISEAFMKGAPFYIEDTQNVIMKEVFRQEVERMKSIEDAQDILKRLRSLEVERADFYAEDEKGGIKNYNHYEKYYNIIYQKIGHKLLKLGYSKDEINSKLEEYKYQKQEYFPGYTEEEQEETALEMVDDLVDAFEKRAGQKYNPDRHTIAYVYDEKNDLYMTVRRNDCTLDDKIFVKAFYGDYSRYFIDFLPKQKQLPSEVLRELKIGGKVIDLNKEKALAER